MLKLAEVFLGVCGHGDVTNPLVVVPINGEIAIEGSSSVNGDSMAFGCWETMAPMAKRIVGSTAMV